MFRRTITCGRPLVAESVSTYSRADWVWPLSPSGSVPLRKMSPALAAMSMNCAVVNFFQRRARFAHPRQVLADDAGVDLADGNQRCAVAMIDHFYLIELS